METASTPTTGSAPLTVADALRLPIVREGVPEVLAGYGQLGRPIRWVHSGEFPDMPAVLKGGELLLTHGMSIPASEERRRRYLADLARAGIAALVIELGSPVREIPRPLVEEARRHDLPLIALHRQIPWIEVTEAIHGTIVRRQDALIERRQELHERLVSLLVAGAGVAEILQALAESAGNPIVLSHEGELLYAASRELDDELVASAWESAARHLPGAPPTLDVSVSVSGDPHWGIASIVALQRPLDPLDRVALEGAVPVLALAFLRAHETETLAARERGDFLDTLLDPAEPLAEHQAYRRAAAIGFRTRSSWLLPLAAELAAGHGRLDERGWALVGRDVREQLTSRQTAAVVGTLRQQGHLALVVGLSAPEQRDEAARAVSQMIERALERTIGRTGGETATVVCAGAPAASWLELREPLRETVDAVPAMRHAPQQRWHDVSKPSLRRLLWTLHHDPALLDFAARSLAPLLEHDARRGTHLLDTLATHCACSGRKAEAARALHLERQSLYKRLAKIESLLGVDLGDEDTLLGLHLAIRARSLLPGAGR